MRGERGTVENEKQVTLLGAYPQVVFLLWHYRKFEFNAIVDIFSLRELAESKADRSNAGPHRSGDN
jgi:hypothetical protein